MQDLQFYNSNKKENKNGLVYRKTKILAEENFFADFYLITQLASTTIPRQQLSTQATILRQQIYDDS